MDESRVPEARIVLALLERVLRDREMGIARSVEWYQQMFPGHADVVARELGATPFTEPNQRVVHGAVPERIGSYRVLRVRGQGGMGTVYEAEQEEPVRRRVALKVIKPGMDSELVLRRFEAERQALAMMEHNNIARVFDAGTTESDQPYFAMEFVEGEPLTAFCDRHRLTVNERLALFRQVCAGAQHAHQKGVIHRDLKPGNVLVSDQDGTATVKIIDFGIARATGQHVDDATALTQHGQFVGTPEYMSPEQAGSDPANLDTRSDVYALGVLLYELLVGQLPFTSHELRQAGLAEMQRRICQVDPPRPSTRLTAAGTTSDLAGLRSTNARTLAKRIQGDLDWIVMKALEKDPDRRYQDTGALAEDIARHLAHEPVQARAPNARDRLVKFVRRNPTKSVGIGLGGIALAVVTTLLLITRASLRRARAVGLANARELVGKANPTTALLLARHAVQVDENVESLSSLYGALASVQELAEETFDGQVDSVAFSSDGTRLLARALGDARKNRPASVRLYAITRRDERIGLSERRRTPPAHDVSAVTFLRGDRVLVLYPEPGVTDRQRAEIWNRDGEVTGGFTMPGGVVRRVASQGDGSRIAFVQDWRDNRGLSGKRVIVCDARGTRVGAPLPVPRADMLALRFSPDGSHLAVGVTGFAFPNRAPRANGVILWKPDRGTWTERTWAGDIAWPIGLDFGGNDRLLVTARKPCVTRLYDIPFDGERGGPQQQVALAGESSGGSRFHPSSRYFITGCNDKLVRIWDLEGRVRAELRHGATPALAAISSDGSRLVTTSQDESARLWSFEEDASSPGGIRVTQLAELRGHSRLVRTADLSADRSLVATGGMDRTLRLWDAVPRAVPVLRHPPELFWATFQPGTGPGVLLTAGADGTVRTWNRNGSTAHVVLRRHGDRVNFAGFSPAGDRAVTAGSDGTARVWNLETGLEICRLVAGKAIGLPGRPMSVRRSTEFYTARFSPDARFVVATCRMGAFVWKVAERSGPVSEARDAIGQIVTRRQGASSASFSPDGTRVLVASFDGYARVFTFEDPSRKRPWAATLALKHAGSVADARFSPDGETIATCSGQDAILWNLEGEQLTRLRGHQGEVRSVAFSPDGQRIITGSKDGTARIWGPDGHTRVVLRGHESFVTNAEFSDDGRLVLTASQDGTVRLWPADAAAAMALARRWAFRGFNDAERERYAHLIATRAYDGR